MGQVGDTFQRETKYHRHKMPGTILDWASKPKIYKNYQGSEQVVLPPITAPDEYFVYDAIRNRMSIRQFKDIAVSRESLSYLLWASTGISRKEGGYEFRTAPSAGALYPIETYICVNNVEDINSGIYHYSIKNHSLELLKKGDFAFDVAKTALDQRMCIEAAVVFIWTAIFQRSKWKYAQRAYRYVYLDAGHIAENLALAATSLSLGSCHIAAIYDDEANNIIDVDGIEESVIYMTVVGMPA